MKSQRSIEIKTLQDAERAYRILRDDVAEIRVDFVTQKLTKESSPEFSGLTIGSISPSQAVMTDADNDLVSADYLNQSVKTTASPTFADETITGLSASQAVMTNADKKLVSADYLNQAVKSTSSPTFADLTSTGLTASQVVMTDANKKLVSADYLNQAVKSTSSPTFAGETLSGLNVAGIVKNDSSGVLSTHPHIHLASEVDGVLPVANGGRGVRSSTTTNLATLTPDIDSYDMYALTAQTDTLVMANPTGTPVQGQKLIVRIYTAAAETITWSGTYYRSVTGSALPVVTVAGKTLYLGLIWNADATKWDLVATAQEA